MAEPDDNALPPRKPPIPVGSPEGVGAYLSPLGVPEGRSGAPTPSYDLLFDQAGNKPVEPLDPSTFRGAFDGFAGKVVSVYYRGTTVQRDIRAVAVRRIDLRWDATKHEPLPMEVPQGANGPTPILAYPMPLPPKHDTPTDTVRVNDIVTVLGGRDGRHWYLVDDDPFIGKVVNAKVDTLTPGGAIGAGAETESNCGGAGLTSLTVRRQLITGNAETPEIPTRADLQYADESYVEYANVIVIKQGATAHSYRLGDEVLVHRKGWWFFALPAHDSFLGQIVALGPDDEADFTTNHYWIKEVTPTVTYQGDGDSWTWTWAASGRWVDAINLNEHASEHNLTSASVDDPPLVIHTYADATSGEHAYAFHGAAGFVRWCKIENNLDPDPDPDPAVAWVANYTYVLAHPYDPPTATEDGDTDLKLQLVGFLETGLVYAGVANDDIFPYIPTSWPGEDFDGILLTWRQLPPGADTPIYKVLMLDTNGVAYWDYPRMHA